MVAFNRLASGHWVETVKLGDLANDQELRSLKGHPGANESIWFSPDGKRVAFVNGPEGSRLRELKGVRTIVIWDIAGGRELRTLPGHTGNVSNVAFSHDGSRLASASCDHLIKVWDVVSGQELRTLEGHTTWVDSVAYSPDGSRLISGSHDGTIKVWDAASGQVLRTLKGHAGPVSRLAFSPDGRRFVSGSQDNTVKIWDAASGRELRTLKGHTNVVWGVAFSPDGSQLASSSADGTIKLWDARPWTPELRRQREALGLLEYWCPKSPAKEKVSERIRADKGITEEVRHEALSSLEEFWPRHIRTKAKN
jgi:WD40 repeat protein